VVAVREAELRQAGFQDGGQARRALGDAFEPLRAVVDRVHAGDHRRQHLGGADVAGGLFAADVLLARLQREAIGRVAVRVDADADQPAGHGALVVVAAGHVGRVRAAGAHRHAQALRAADHDVGAHLARGLEQGERQQVGREDGGRAPGVDFVRLAAPVHQPAAAGRVLDEGGEVVVGGDGGVPLGGRAGELDRQAQRRGARAQHLDGLGVRVAEHHDGVALGLDRAARQRHGLGGGGGFVEHGGVGDRHAGEVAHHGLEVDQRLHAALADLGLVRCVGGVPGGVLQDVAQDHARQVAAVIALADEALHLVAVAAGHGLELGQRVGFGAGRRQVHRRAARDVRRQDRVDQRLARGLADDRQHVGLLGRAGADVAGDEFTGVFQFGQGGVAHGAREFASKKEAARARQTSASSRSGLQSGQPALNAV